jgi:hypothetical protein
MKSLVFDAGPVISLTTNNLLWILEYLKHQFNGQFYIPDAVKHELVDRPLMSRKFKFEALQVGSIIKEDVLTTIGTQQIKLLAEELLELANHSFKTKGNWLKIVHYAEMEVLATAAIMNASAAVVDERTTKLLVEDTPRLISMFEQKFGSKIFVNQKNIDAIRKWTNNLKIIRSVELVIVAYEKGVFDKYLPEGAEGGKTLVESLLWGVKIHGCAISLREIDDLVKLETDVPASTRIA